VFLDSREKPLISAKGKLILLGGKGSRKRRDPIKQRRCYRTGRRGYQLVPSEKTHLVREKLQKAWTEVISKKKSKNNRGAGGNLISTTYTFEKVSKGEKGRNTFTSFGRRKVGGRW